MSKQTIHMFSSFQVNTYVVEIAQPNLRGILASVSTVSVILGVLTQFFLGTFFSWKTVSLVSIVVPVMSIIGLSFIPESPYWLISKCRFQEAKQSLAWLRGTTNTKDIEPEFDDLCRQIIKIDKDSRPDSKLKLEDIDPELVKKSSNMFNFKIYCSKRFIWPYSLITFCFCLVHFSGITPLQTYAITIFSTLESPIDKYYATIILGVAEVLGCVVSTCLIYQLGKRHMNFFSLAGTSFCFLIAASYTRLADINYLENVGTDSKNATWIEASINPVLTKYSWLPTAALISGAFFVHCGIRILPWVLTGEVYSPEICSNAAGLSGFTTYVISFVANKVFLNMVDSFTLSGTFWFYSGVSLVGLLVLYFVLPETEGKSLYEITEHFAGNLKLDNNVSKGNEIKCQDVVEGKTPSVFVTNVNV